ncbi:TPA: hypothetical protein ACPZDL_000664 [Citrobacter freundii]|uniref:hypothetical protein n=1 Tax=Citrobacter freundii TaxID=546 RepID=UPI0028EC1143|nr:hypothetical protein [Citrobacter freundii]WNT04100.1 hypothetical protein RRL14_10090 [Citrobacter freundii]HCL6313878.1 hypothetical protein [Citrobacter freundii]
MTTNHPAHGPVSLDRLHQIREILSKASAQSDGGNIGYAMADAVKVIDGAIAAFGVDNKTTHNSVIAEQLAHILSVMEVTDHQRAIIRCAVDRLNKNADTICQLSKAACSSPDSLDYQGAKELFNYLMTEEETNATVNGWNACRAAMLQAGNSPVTPDNSTCKYCGGTGYFRWKKSANNFPCPCMGCDLPAAPLQEVK